MKAAVTGIVIIIVLAAGLGAGYLAGASSGWTRMTTLTSVSTYTQTSVVTTTVMGTATSIATSAPIPISSVEVANVSVGGSPRTIAVNPSAGRIYVADWSSNVLTVIDAQSLSVIATVTLPGDNNNGIAIDLQTGMVYVLVDGGVAEVNGSTNRVVGELPLNFGPGSLAYDPVTHVIYGSPESLGNSSLVGADIQTGLIAANISLGYWADSVAFDPQTNTIVAAGCNQEGLVCNSVVSVVNATSETLVATVHLGSWGYPRVTVNPEAAVAYVSGAAQLVALNSFNGAVIYNSNSQACGVFDSMAFDSSSNQVIAVSLDYNYLMVYNGATLALANMYSFSGSPQYVAHNPNTNELYVTLPSGLLAFHPVAVVGHANSTLTGSGQNCPLP